MEIFTPSRQPYSANPGTTRGIQEQIAILPSVSYDKRLFHGGLLT